MTARQDETPGQREFTSQPAGQPATAPAGILRQQAVVVGIGQYLQVPRLANAVSDAQAVGDLLQREYGFDLLPGGAMLLDESSTLFNLRQIIHDSLAQADLATRWLFYFAGHGMVAENEGYLLPVDARPGQLDSSLSLSWLVQACRQSTCGEALIILDACYSGSALLRPDELSDLIPAAGQPDRLVQIVSSGNPDQPVLDGGGRGHSVFTQSLLEGLQGWPGIHEADGRLRFSRLLDHLVFDVPGRLRALGFSTTSQRPVGGAILRSRREQRDFTFTSQRPRLDPQVLQAARADDPSWRQKALADLAATGEPDSRGDAALLAAAAELAAAHTRRAGSEGAAFLVTAFLDYEPVAAVRSQAAAALGELGDPSAAGALLALLDDEPQVCRAAAAALGRLQIPQASGALLERLRTAPDDLFLDLIEAIGAIGDQPAVLAALQLALKQKKLVPFVGPDFPAEQTGLPDRAALARELAQRGGLPPGSSLAEAAAATMQGTTNRFAFTSFLRRALDDQLLQPGPVYQRLAELGLPLWLSAAYDGLLGKALKANSIVLGSDTQYWRPDRPAVVRVAGDLAGLRGEVVIERDYAALRQNEGDRKLLTGFLRQELAGKVVLFLGFDPASPDFALLVEHVLNHHLAGVEARAFLVWHERSTSHTWSGHPMTVWTGETMPFLTEIIQAE